MEIILIILLWRSKIWCHLPKTGRREKRLLLYIVWFSVESIKRSNYYLLSFHLHFLLIIIYYHFISIFYVLSDFLSTCWHSIIVGRVDWSKNDWSKNNRLKTIGRKTIGRKMIGRIVILTNRRKSLADKREYPKLEARAWKYKGWVRLG